MSSQKDEFLERISPYPELSTVNESSIAPLREGQFRFHIPGLQHTIVSPEYSACAFTQKIVKFCKMMHSQGHIVIVYGHPDSKVDCTELVPVISRDYFNLYYPRKKWKRNPYKQSDFKTPVYKYFDERCILEIQRRKQNLDFLLLFWGIGGQTVAEAHSDLLIVEPGIGYPSFIPLELCPYKVFESYSKMNLMYGEKEMSPAAYHEVIPNYFDENDFSTMSTSEKDANPYFLYLGRVVHIKGVEIAIRITRKLGVKLIVAGQGKIKDFYSGDISHVIEIGFVSIDVRKMLLAGAQALIVPSLYNEPFGGVAIEALYSGVPVIASDFGAFPEFVLQGITGFRCKTLNQFITAARSIHKINSQACRTFAHENYSLERSYDKYNEFFKRVIGIYTKKDFSYMQSEDDYLKNPSEAYKCLRCYEYKYPPRQLE